MPHERKTFTNVRIISCKGGRVVYRQGKRNVATEYLYLHPGLINRFEELMVEVNRTYDIVQVQVGHQRSGLPLMEWIEATPHKKKLYKTSVPDDNNDIFEY